MYNILIIEDELLIAAQLEYGIKKHGYQCAGIAISYDEALIAITSTPIDLVLLDITIFGAKTGLDIGKKIDTDYKIPFIYLTSYTDMDTIAKIKATNPNGYLPKPINEVALTTMMDIILSAGKKEPKNEFLNLFAGKKYFRLHLPSILYFKVDHIYVEFHKMDKTKQVIRISLSEVLIQFPEDGFKKINRNTVINTAKITKIAGTKIFLGTVSFTVTSKVAGQLLNSISKTTAS